ncbi:MAG: tail-specific protease [marine bacterium B5-7]|nr:MAG: tail-specific protease [marine bacterium B5-7]
MPVSDVTTRYRNLRLSALRILTVALVTFLAGFAALSVSLTSQPTLASSADASSTESHVSNVPVGSMDIEPKHIYISRLIRSYMDQRHYVKIPLDDTLSEHILDRYLKSLDPTRQYFLQQDINKFDEIRDDFDDYIKSSRLEPAFAIFLVFRTRVRKQVDHALDILDKPFNFEIDENYIVDRSDAPWAKDQQELDDLWRKRVKNDLLGLMLSGKEEDDARETLRKRYAQIRNRTEQLNANDVFEFYINAYLQSVEPHTNYLSPRASENFKMRMSLSLEGIGAVLQPKDEYTQVTRVVPGGPADTAGELHAGDRIVGVGQDTSGEMEDVIGWRLDSVVDKIRGPKGSTVRLKILPKKAGNLGDTQVISIVRDKINLEEQAAKKSVLEFSHDGHDYKFGVIDLPTFYADFEGRNHGDPLYRSTTKDVRKLIKELNDERIDALIIDLRGNGGGALSEAISLTGLFIESGPIVQVRDASGAIRINVDPDPTVSYTGPLAVMVDRNSASASEIFAGAIQDYRRGLIIGEPTFGKGTVQNLVSLDRHSRNDESLGELKLTIAQFFRVDGESTQNRGVVPDIMFPTAANSEKEGERSFDNALPWSSIPPAKYETQYTVGDSNLLLDVVERFKARQQSSPGMLYVHEAEMFNYDARNTESLSLNLTKRKQELDARRIQSNEIENTLRRARGLEPVEVEEIVDDEDEFADEENDDPDKFPPDVLLEEAGFILADLIEIRDEPHLVHTDSNDTASVSSQVTD